MKLLAISGSLKSTSTNTALTRALLNLDPENWEIILYQGLGDLPHFNPEIDTETPPAAVEEFRSLIRTADAVFICTPEYAFGVPGSLKNALDWTVSSGELVEKPVAAISASPSYSGGDKAHASLLLTLSALSAQIPDEAKFSVPAIIKKLNAAGDLTDIETEQRLRNALNGLERTVRAVSGSL
jgi:chromate reductase, NAD(P)H dehydrogenase (quinone)